MKVSELKTCLRRLARNVNIFKKEESNPILEKAVTAYKDALADENSTDEEVNDAFEFFDMISDRWYKSSNKIDEISEKLFNQFADFDGDKVILKSRKLERALDLFPNSELGHLLVLALKCYGLSQRTKFSQKYRELGNVNEYTTLSEETSKVSRVSISERCSLRQHLIGKEEKTMNEMSRVSLNVF